MRWITPPFLPPAAAFAGCLLLALGGCAHKGVRPTPAVPPAAPAPAPTLPRSDAATLTALDAILAGPQRTAANRARDAYRHPKETLQFFGVRSDQTVMEVWAAPGGWYTEILAPLLREHGRYIAANWDPAANSPLVRETRAAYQAKLAANAALYDRVTVTALQAPGALQPVAPGSVDVVLSFRNLHNWMARDTALPMLKAMFAALKPGGILGLVDHRADPAAAADPKARLGYVGEAQAIALAQEAGFELVDRSEINANPRDTRDYDLGVWALPPTWRLGDKDRDRYATIGESDRFTLRFVKPVRSSARAAR